MLPEPSGSLPEDRQPIMEDAMPERSEGSQQASQRVPEDDGQTVNAGTKSTTPEVERDAPFLCRSGRADSYFSVIGAGANRLARRPRIKTARGTLRRAAGQRRWFRRSSLSGHMLRHGSRNPALVWRASRALARSQHVAPRSALRRHGEGNSACSIPWTSLPPGRHEDATLALTDG